MVGGRKRANFRDQLQLVKKPMIHGDFGGPSASFLHLKSRFHVYQGRHWENGFI